MAAAEAVGPGLWSVEVPLEARSAAFLTVCRYTNKDDEVCTWWHEHESSSSTTALTADTSTRKIIDNSTSKLEDDNRNNDGNRVVDGTAATAASTTSTTSPQTNGALYVALQSLKTAKSCSNKKEAARVPFPSCFSLIKACLGAL